MATKRDISRLLRTAKGQIDGILKMIKEDRECLEISTQISAAQSILKKVNIEILTSHLSICIKESFINDDEKERQIKLEKFTNLLNKIIK